MGWTLVHTDETIAFLVVFLAARHHNTPRALPQNLAHASVDASLDGVSGTLILLSYGLFYPGHREASGDC